MHNIISTVQRAETVTLSDGLTIELELSEYAVHHSVELSFVEGTSMDVDVILQEYDDVDNTWRGALQHVLLISTDSGAPEVVNANTASAAATAGGVAVNTTGITGLVDDSVVKLQAPGNGKKKRLFFNLDGGSGTVSYSYTGAAR